MGELSGGETMLIAILGLRVRQTPITLLDEPTNNLDRPTRERAAHLVETWPGTLVVVSHDLDLLGRVDETAELHAGRLTVFGGPYTAWREHLEAEQGAAVQAARSAEQALKVEKRQRAEAESKLAQRARTGRAAQLSGGIPKILAGNRASKAQASAGSMRTGMDARVQAAQAALDAADARVRDDEHIHLTLPDPDVPRSRQIAELHGTNRSIILQGPERVALVGPNGVGKTSLLEQMLQGAPATPGRASGELHVSRVGYLTQRLDGLDDCASALANVGAAAPHSTPGRSATSWRDCSCAATVWNVPWRRCLVGRGSGCRSRDCCSPTRPPSCSCWTSPRTTSMCAASSSSSRRSTPTAVRSSSSATTTASWRGRSSTR